MRQLCSDSLCSYLGRSASLAAQKSSACSSDGPGDEAEVSSGHSTYMTTDKSLYGRAKHQPRRSHAYLH